MYQAQCKVLGRVVSKGAWAGGWSGETVRKGHLSWDWRMCRSSPCERGGGRGVNIKDRDPKRFGRSKESQRGRGGE